jgi:hypothetical protein
LLLVVGHTVADARYSQNRTLQASWVSVHVGRSGTRNLRTRVAVGEREGQAAGVVDDRADLEAADEFLQQSVRAAQELLAMAEGQVVKTVHDNLLLAK